MSIARQVEPIKLGLLNDMVLPDDLPIDLRGDMRQTLELVFEDGLAEGLTPRDAARAAVAGPLTDDSTVTRGLVEMIDAYLADQPA